MAPRKKATLQLTPLILYKSEVSMSKADKSEVGTVLHAPVKFAKFTRTVERDESPIDTASRYSQRSCFVVADHRLAPDHRALDSEQPGTLRFGRVLYWVRQPPSLTPLRAVVKLFRYLDSPAVDRVCRALPRGLGRKVWRAQHMVDVGQFTEVCIPVEFCTRGTVIAMHVQRLAREQGLAFCLPSLPREY